MGAAGAESAAVALISKWMSGCVIEVMQIRSNLKCNRWTNYQ